MKRTFYTLLFFTLLALPTVAQDFKLFYAKNVTDVTQFRNMTQMDKELKWREVSNGAIDGNRDDVMKVKEMLSQTRMKGLADQQLFWKMRDEMLLCFRIDDPSSKNSNFRVEVNYGKNGDGKDIKQLLTTRKYFFANMPMASEEISISVWRLKEPKQRINFRYFVYDWDDENLYIFQLDQKRQSTGDTYKMEYVTSYVDEEGDAIPESHILELKETKFQSFYVPKGQSLTDVYFLTGNDKEGNVKLRMDMEEIHPGIDLDHQLEVPSLLPTFKLAKHENRELMNFNWVGTGLFEKYDTLYIKLFNEKGKTINKANMNIHRVDDDGEPMPDNTLKYLGYDSGSKCHKLLTFGHPAYIEILVNNYLPLVYRYKGAADRMTNIVSSDLCSAKLTLRPGNPDASGIAIADQYFRFLHDEAIAVNRISGQDTLSYSVCSLKEENISGKMPSENVSYMDNGGNDYPKLYNNKPIKNYAEFEVVFSAPKGGSSPQSKMTVTEVVSKKTHEASPANTEVISAAKFNNFTRDYYFVRYDMSSSLPRNKECVLTLSTPNATYNKFPSFSNSYKNNEEEKATNKEAAQELTSPPDVRKNDIGGEDEPSFGIMLPTNFKFSTPHFTFSTGTTWDFWKQTFNTFISGELSTGLWGPAENTKEADERKAAQDNAKKVANWKYKKGREYDADDPKKKQSTSASLTDTQFKYEDWVINELESVFKVNAKHIGWYLQGGAKLSFKMPLFAYTLPNITKPQLADFNVWAQFGYGQVFVPGDMTAKDSPFRDAQEVAQWFGLNIDVGAQFDVNARIDAGIKSYGKKNQYEWSSEDKGFYLNGTFTAMAGVWAGLKTNSNPYAQLDFGVRAGLKAQFAAGLMVPFSNQEKDFYWGIRAAILGGAQFHASFRSLIIQASYRASAQFGWQKLFPDNFENPFHSNFPFWLPDKPKKNVRQLNRVLPALEPNAMGRPLVNSVLFDANPHFLNANQVVYNNGEKADDYNDDHVNLATISGETVTKTETLSIPGTSASQHMRSKYGSSEIVVYQQSVNAVDNATITDENKVAAELEQAAHTQIRAAIRQDDGTWKQTVVTPDDGWIDRFPVATAQKDGKAAVLYQHGKVEAIDPAVSIDSINNQRFVGDLMLRTYDPAKGWSEPTKMFYYDKDAFPLKYDLVMRNDTVLTGFMVEFPNNKEFGTITGKYLTYAWKAPQEDQVFYSHGDLSCVDFFMNRVGEHAVVAKLYERPDTLREIYIKTLNMDGSDDGLAGSDLKIGRTMPLKLKIITDRSDENSNDFAVLWTQGSTSVLDAENGNKGLDKYSTVINAVRIQLTDAPQMTYPLTVAAERDDLVMGDFDGYLDDALLKVVYTLTNTDTKEAVVMYNEKEFTNSFVGDVTYSREALLGSSTLPVNVFITNTGTSVIKAAAVTINGQKITIPNVMVPPLEQEKYVVQYPISDDFDGYIQSSVEVEYANVFKARMQSRGRKAPRNLLRHTKSFDMERVAAGSIDCKVVSRSVEDGTNTFIVEVTDRSSRGLAPGTAVQVGAYIHPSAMDIVYKDAKVLVRPEDFTRMGGVRKAYAELTVSGITETIDGYIAGQIVDLFSTEEKESDDDEGPRVLNTCPEASPSFVQFLPTGEPTDINAPTMELTKNHRVVATVQDNGIMLSNLEPGDDIRLFSSAGWTIYIGQATSTTHFVPLKRHDVYIISAAKEVFKFTY